MNAKTLAPFLMANTTVVIDINGQLRELIPGEVPGPGEVIVVVGQGATAATDIDAQLVTDDGETFDINLDNEIASIFEQIEQGVDPTQNEDFATAAGGQNGSSPTGSGDIERTGAETLAETEFDTSGLESQGLSETQSLTLLDVVAQAIFVGDDSVTVFETDAAWVVNGSIEATETDVPTFIVQEDVAGENGTFSIDADGNWTYVANSAFDELNIGDSLVDVFPIESADGTVGSVTVTINGTNDLPQFVATNDIQTQSDGDVSTFAFEDGAYSFDIPENSLSGAVLGQVAAVDPDNDVLIFSISTNIQNGEGEDLFQIDPDTGEISLTDAGAASYVNDFELLENAHQIVVTVTEGDGIGEPQSVDVDVFFNELNEDDNEPIFEGTDEGGEYSFQYNENSLDEDVIGTVSANDGDGENVTYSIKTNVLNESDEPLFEIDSATGEISLTVAGVAAFTNDFELEANIHEIIVTATEDDGLGTIKSTDVTVNLEELDLDDNAPVFADTDESGEYNFEYNENSVDADVLGTVSASDADGENITFSISANVFNDADEPLFEIDSISGEISLTAAGVAAFTNDYELAANEHSITVTATEDEGFGDVKSTDVTVNLSELNLDDNAPVFYDGEEPTESYAFSYNENSADGDVLGTVVAIDADGENVTYSITTNVLNDADEPLFEIDANSGEISLTAAGVAAFTNDYELAANVHNIVVTATEDEGLGEVKTTDVPVQLTELNLDDNAPVFYDGEEPTESYAFSYNENSADGDVLGTVVAIDADGENVTYSITTNVLNDADEPLFEVDANSGEISLTAAGVAAFTNDYELAANVHNIVVTATEDEGLGEVKTTDVPVQLTELNLDDNAPVFYDGEEPTESYAFSYNENSADDDVLGTVVAIDADGENVTYSITTNVLNDADEPLFEIDANSGEISLTAAGVAAFTNDYELAANVHNIVVTATEDEGLGEVKTTDVPVQLTELNLDDNEPVFQNTNEQDEYYFSYDENSTDAYVIGTVSATDADGEAITYSIKTNVFNDADEALFEIDSGTGEISLTVAGVIAFTNDYELATNVHNLVVTATEVAGLGEVKATDVNVTLEEINLDDNAPVFDPNDGDQYSFSYFENNNDEYVIGTVSATDADGEAVTYSIKTNVFNDSNEPLFVINPSSGAISLTSAGVLAFTNNFEALANVHNLVITATEVDGFGTQKATDIDVVLSELNVNEIPVAEDFDVDAGDAIIVPIVFDSDDESLDHISDEDDDFNDVQLNVMITSLPQYGTLLYTDEFGETRVLTEADLHSIGDAVDIDKLFNPDNITYVPGVGDPFEIGYSGDSEDIVLDEDGFYNWGEYVSDTERLITLENGNTIGISITDNNDKPLKQYTGGKPHVGWGIGDTDGNGMNKQETLIVDLSDNPLDVVTFGLDGMGGSFNTNSNVYVEVTYTFEDGTTHVEQYQKDEGDVGNSQILYDFSYSSPDNPIVQMELSSTGGNWELRYISGTQDITEDVTFDYVAVDSDLAVSNEATVTIDVSDSPEYEVLSAEQGDELTSQLGNQMMLGDSDDNVFTWLDSTLDSGTDVVDNFELGSDLIDLTDILEDDDNVEVADLIDKIEVAVDDDDVVLTVTDEGKEQTIVMEGVTSSFEDAGLIVNDAITDEFNMLTQILKTDAA
ncbi:outer membrane adhesin like proteiin [Vibrio coralliilyticus]|uniref:Outer membrane adhesin like proteiin n=1 Tax=Vibrio coralliilyticus TaxID=190893 RepID=A0A837GDI9_9VIBR|nr:cadherin domain-containing protein [Vibrio coralliilyticus]KJY71058.1 outer membrane adhesin like proteiin [Vibrio coralliilyticus]QOU31246.1 cadherin domain-containing protein [Vibrio coralliilyticus]